MELQQTIGIVLRSIPFKERDLILTLFTPQHGLLTLYAKGGKKKALQALCETLTEAEFYFYPTKGEMGKLENGEIICQHIAIRDSYSCLDSAFKLAKATLAFLWPARQTPKLYFLLSHFLKNLPAMLDPSTLYAAYLLKVLYHEGILQLEPHCCRCEEKLAETYRFGGETFCKAHLCRGALPFTKEEEEALRFLTCNRLFAKMQNIKCPPSFLLKIETLFSHWIESPLN